jgi:hypothetical protein
VISNMWPPGNAGHVSGAGRIVEDETGTLFVFQTPTGVVPGFLLQEGLRVSFDQGNGQTASQVRPLEPEATSLTQGLRNAGAARAGAVVRQYTVPPAARDFPLRLQLQGTPPIHNLRFIAAGRPSIVVKQIAGVAGPTVTFEPPVRPFEVTVHFAHNPIALSGSLDFIALVDNMLDDPITVEFGAVYDP